MYIYRPTQVAIRMNLSLKDTSGIITAPICLLDITRLILYLFFVPLDRNHNHDHYIFFFFVDFDCHPGGSLLYNSSYRNQNLGDYFSGVATSVIRDGLDE